MLFTPILRGLCGGFADEEGRSAGQVGWAGGGFAAKSLVIIGGVKPIIIAGEGCGEEGM